MHRSIVALPLAAALALVAAPSLAGEPLQPKEAGGHVIDESQTPRFLVVLSGASGSFDGDTLILQRVPAVTYFSDRPARIAGHMSVEEFVESWNQGSESFAADPPNAVLSVLAEGGPDDVVIELLNVSVAGDAVEFVVEVLDGTLPEGSFGPASLFIDPDTVPPLITDA